jgi:hypothetical protein
LLSAPCNEPAIRTGRLDLRTPRGRVAMGLALLAQGLAGKQG